MQNYWKVPKDPISSRQLSPSEAIVLADLADWQGRNGQGCSQAERASRCGLTVRGLQKILLRLAEKGLLQGEQSSYPNTNKVRTKGEQSSYPPHTPPIIGEHEEHMENVENCARTHDAEIHSAEESCRENVSTPQPPSSALVQEEHERHLHAAIMQGWQAHYRQCFGTDYLLTRGSITAEVADLAPAIAQLASQFQRTDIAAFCADLFSAMYHRADSWQQSNWNLRIISRQFNDLLKPVINGVQQPTHSAPTDSCGYNPAEIADMLDTLYAS